MADILRAELTVDTSKSYNSSKTAKIYSISKAASDDPIKVDWGDGTSTTVVSRLSHTYSVGGIYTIKIYNASIIALNSNTGDSSYEDYNRIYTEISLLSGITTINKKSFYRCSSLTSINIPDSVTSIGDYAFYNCSELTGITIPDSVPSIGSYAFNNCSSLTSVTIGNSVTSIGGGAFEYCSGLTSITIPDSVTSIGSYAFDGCSKLTNITIPDSVTSIGDYAFRNCSSLTSAAIGKGVTKINKSTFTYCSKLATITIENTITSIDNYAFDGCSVLKTVKFNGTQAQWNTLLNNVSSTGNQYFKSATVQYAKQLNYNTMGGTLQEGFDNPTFAINYPNPLPTCSSGTFPFEGWYKDTDLTVRVVAGSNIDVTTIYAKFAASITYNLDGATNNSLNKSTYSAEDVENGKLLYSPTKADYDFEGWYTESTFVNKIDSFSGLTGQNLTLYAKFSTKDSYQPKYKAEDNSIKELPLDAKTVRGGNDPYISINLSSISKMDELYALITDINAKNEHAIFDASMFIDGAYVCLINMYESGSTRYCEIIDMLNAKTYYNLNGFNLEDDVDDYLSSCTRKDNYANIGIAGISTMGDLRAYINKVNSHGDHCFFDFSSYVSGAYVCTIQMYTLSTVNYCFIFDILNGKLYGSYTGYDDSTTVANYCQGTVSDLVHAVNISDANITLQQVIELFNRVNIIGHHVLLDISALSSADYLITFTYTTEGENTTCRAVGLVNGTITARTYASSDLSTTTLASFFENYSDSMVGKNYVDSNFVKQPTLPPYTAIPFYDAAHNQYGWKDFATFNSGNAIPIRDAQGRFQVGNITSTSDGLYVANKNYVDNAVAGAGGSLYRHDIRFDGEYVSEFIIFTSYPSAINTKSLFLQEAPNIVSGRIFAVGHQDNIIGCSSVAGDFLYFLTAADTNPSYFTFDYNTFDVTPTDIVTEL